MAVPMYDDLLGCRKFLICMRTSVRSINALFGALALAMALLSRIEQQFQAADWLLQDVHQNGNQYTGSHIGCETIARQLLGLLNCKICQACSFELTA